VLSALLHAAAPGPATVADAAMAQDKEAVLSLLKQGGDVNAAQGDGMTERSTGPRMHGDAALAGTLLYAGGNVRATTRSSLHPLRLASQDWHARG